MPSRVNVFHVFNIGYKTCFYFFYFHIGVFFTSTGTQRWNSISLVRVSAVCKKMLPGSVLCSKMGVAT